MQPYLHLLQRLLDEGEPQNDRTGTGTLSLFGEQMKFDLREGFPVLTTKRVHLKSVFHELLWMISGSTNNNDLERHGVTIWREWAREDGSLGPIYGAQWRQHAGVRRSQVGPDGRAPVIYTDQLAQVITQLITAPNSRRIIMDSWNVSELADMSLTPCHNLVQCRVSSPWLDLALYQRSADVFLGVPFNIAFYATLTHMLAQVSGLRPRMFTWIGGDTHLYLNHTEQARQQLRREPRPLPTLHLNPEVRRIDDFRFEDIEVRDYHPAPGIKADVSV